MLLWTVFTLIILFLLYLDLFVFFKKAHVVKFKEALIWSIVWIALALVFNAWIYFVSGPQRALNFFTGYLIERTLSIDNLFVFLIIINYFKVPAKNQHGILFWGIFGALVVRGIFIVVGVTIIGMFHWTIYLFGLFLVVTGFKTAMKKEKRLELEKNPILKIFRQFVPVTEDYVEDKFFVKRNGRVWATPLLVALLVIEVADVIFAVDSIPAILAITTDPFIVYSSNIFAILGLRALYFALAAIMDMFCYLNYGLAVILIFIGGKMMLQDFFEIPVALTLGVVIAVLTFSMLASIMKSKKKSVHNEG